MTARRAIAGLLAASLAATTAYAQSTESGAKSQPSKQQSIDLRRDANEAWSEMRKGAAEARKGVPAVGREAGKTFSEAGGKVRDGFTGKAPPTIPDPPK
jgi:hypothetical protein